MVFDKCFRFNSNVSFVCQGPSENSSNTSADNWFFGCHKKTILDWSIDPGTELQVTKRVHWLWLIWWFVEIRIRGSRMTWTNDHGSTCSQMKQKEIPITYVNMGLKLPFAFKYRKPLEVNRNQSRCWMSTHQFMKFPNEKKTLCMQQLKWHHIIM